MQHSSEALRAFYLIALTKDLSAQDSPDQGGRYERVAGEAVTLSRERLPLPPSSQEGSAQCEPSESTNEAEAVLATEGDIVNLDFNLDLTKAGAWQSKSFWKNSLSLRNDSPCQQCRLLGFQCDLKRPSCWKCQRYRLPCYYESDGTTASGGQYCQQIEMLTDPKSEPVSWQDSVRTNPYYNLEGKGKLYRVGKRSRKSRGGRLSKPTSWRKSERSDVEEALPDDIERLLEIYSPITSEVDTASRAASPTDWPLSEPAHQFSRLDSSSSSGYTTSLASAESMLTGPSPRPSLLILGTPKSGESSTWQAQRNEIHSDDDPRWFQCTFCLKQCNGQQEWELHELSQHIPVRVWVCMPRGPVEKVYGYDVCVFCNVAHPKSDHFTQHAIQHCYGGKNRDQTFISKDALLQHLSTVHNQNAMTQKMRKWSRPFKNNDWYWNCGFCDTVLPGWTDRVVHIGNHFKTGTVMSSWDPLTPPYPLDRTTLNCAAWFPPLSWDAETLWKLGPERCGFSWNHTFDGQNHCQHCNVGFYFGSEADIKRHEDIWHSRREVWSCPTINDIKAGILAEYFFPIHRQAMSSSDTACPYCNKRFIELAELHCDLDIWDIRVVHLEVDHNFNGCQPPCKSTRAGDILLHLANIHKVSLNEMTADVLESCRKEERPLAKKIICLPPTEMVEIMSLNE